MKRGRVVTGRKEEIGRDGKGEWIVGGIGQAETEKVRGRKNEGGEGRGVETEEGRDLSRNVGKGNGTGGSDGGMNGGAGSGCESVPNLDEASGARGLPKARSLALCFGSRWGISVHGGGFRVGGRRSLDMTCCHSHLPIKMSRVPITYIVAKNSLNMGQF
ncbi:hypothetical protein Tco_0720303 [Tanacetum coccineum]